MATVLEQTDCDKSEGIGAPPRQDCERLVVVGGGMAAQGLCRSLVETGAIERFVTKILGEEPRYAYDRVNLSKFFRGRTSDELLLATPNWYANHNIQFKVGCRIARIDRTSKQVIDSEGNTHDYDRLVLSTGSRAWMPRIPGRDLPGIFVYRTLDDLEKIQQHVRDRQATRGAVIGGGLLGLEAAKVLVDLGLSTSVLEMAPGLMPRQLDNRAAAMLKDRVESIGVDVHLVRRTQSIHSTSDARLRISFENARDLDVDVLIVAAGVRPNDELARDCGLQIGSRGGIVVDDGMQTTDPNIFAIGECISFHDHIYGLVAPCYRMADVLAKRLAGGNETFCGADESAELKLLGVQVATLGRAIGQATGIVLTQQDDLGYRKIILEQGRLVGAACVGDWDELPQIRQAINKQQRLWPHQRVRFRRTGSPWAPGGSLPIADWPDDSVVCACLGVTKQTLCREIVRGTEDSVILAEKTGASTACGSCRPLLCELTGGKADLSPVAAGTRVMLVASILAGLFVALIVLVPPLRFATSVQDAWRNIDVLWRSDLARQISGYTALSLIALGLVFSLRKRTAWFRYGGYTFWRCLHGVLGAAALVAVAVHTGFRLGDNLNFVLATVFLAIAMMGSIAGIASSIEGRVKGNNAMLIRRWRPRLSKIHAWLFWPLPALIAAHVISFYWFSE